jgi:homoserine dehydrogenase
MPTASAVVADMIDTAVGRTSITFRTLELWSSNRPSVTPRDYANVPGRFYLRFDVEDRPGVMAEITAVVGRHGISIASVIQHESDGVQEGIVPLVIMTHKTTEGATQRAVEEIDRLRCVRPGSERIRVSE